MSSKLVLLVVLGSVLLVAGSASACVNTVKPCGPLSIYIDGMGVATMYNDGIAPFQFDAYTIGQPAGCFPPISLVSMTTSGWTRRVSRQCSG